MKSKKIIVLLLVGVIHMSLLGNVSAKTVLKPNDFTFVGGFRVPSGLTYPNGLTHRYINDQLYLYSISGTGSDKGNVRRYAVPDTLTQTYPFAQVSTSINYGDIFQDKLVDVVSNGSGGSPPYIGIAGGATRPGGLFWDEQDQRLYWTKVVSYNNTVGVSDAALGYSKLDDVNNTGTGIGSWKLDPPAPAGFGNRWAFTMTHIPQTIADTYLGGRRLGVGFGGGVSIISNGPPSIGPALFAIEPPSLVNEAHLDYVSTRPIEMLSHPATLTRATRPDGQEYAGYSLRASGYAGTTEYWYDEDTGAHGVWIDTPDKHGVISFVSMGGGNADTTILSSPTPTSTAFAVVDPGDIRFGDIIRVDTSVIRSSSYAWQIGRVQSVDGNIITLQSAVPGTPTVGGRVVCGTWYDAGGPATSRIWHPWYIYNPDDLVAAATGVKNPSELTPTFKGQVDLFGVDYPLPGVPAGASRPYQPSGATFDEVTNRLYLASRIGGGGMEVRVYQLNAEISDSPVHVDPVTTPIPEPPPVLRLQ